MAARAAALVATAVYTRLHRPEAEARSVDELGQLEQLRVMRAREHAGALAAAVEEVAQARVQEGDAVLRIGPLSKLVDEAERTAGGVAHHVAHLRQVSLLKVASVEAPRSTPRPSLHWL